MTSILYFFFGSPLLVSNRQIFIIILVSVWYKVYFQTVFILIFFNIRLGLENQKTPDTQYRSIWLKKDLIKRSLIASTQFILLHFLKITFISETDFYWKRIVYFNIISKLQISSFFYAFIFSSKCILYCTRKMLVVIRSGWVVLSDYFCLGLSLSTFSIFLFKPKTNRNFSDLSEKWGKKLECKYEGVEKTFL